MTFSQCIDFIRSDYYRHMRRHDVSLFRMWLYTWINPGFAFLFWFRLTRCNNPIVSGGARLQYVRKGGKAGIEMPRSVHAGYGLLIAHGGPMVVNGTTRMGDNCNLCHIVNIGSAYHKAAELGNEVYVGPHTCLVENVKIGDGVTIGAGSIVIRDAEAGVTIAGNPARVVSHKTPGRLIYNKWDRAWNHAPVPEGY